MTFFAKIKKKLVDTFAGELIADLGTLPINDYGQELSLSIRRRPGEPPYLQAKLGSPGRIEALQITQLKAWADYHERAIREIRKRIPEV